MKNPFFFLLMAACVITATAAAQGRPAGKRQPAVVASPGANQTNAGVNASQEPGNWRDDSLLWIKNPANTGKPYSRTASPTQVNSPSYVREDSILWIRNPANKGKPYVRPAAPATNNTKLDDLKNPFDTAKKIKTVQPKTPNAKGTDVAMEEMTLKTGKPEEKPKPHKSSANRSRQQ